MIIYPQALAICCNLRYSHQHARRVRKSSQNKGKANMKTSIAVSTPSYLVSLTQQEWWGNLQQGEQKSLQSASTALARALVEHGKSRMAIGRSLAAVQEILEPHGLFIQYLRNFHFSLATAYRYINGWKNVKDRLPEPILEAALSRGLDLIGGSTDKPFGVYTIAAQATPIPRNPTPEAAVKWISTVTERVKSTPREPPPAPELETLLRTAFQSLRTTMRKLTEGERAQFLTTLIGYALSEFRLPIPKLLRLIPPPEEWVKVRGRPVGVAA